MKKALLLVSILFLSVVSTACINNFAVQELNSKAKVYMEEGDYQAAIARLKSSLDLDDTLFETHYNLAVAYTQAEEYNNAIEAYKKAIELNSSIADAYYSLAVAQSNLALDLGNGTARIDDEGNIYTPSEDELAKETSEYKPSEATINTIKELNAEAIENFELYLEKAPNSQDAADVEAKVKELQEAK